MATSTLNPNAPIFVPLAYRAVEDFSDRWWDLVQSSPWYRDYWFHECFQDPQNAPDISDAALPDLDSLFGDDDFVTENNINYNTTNEKGSRMDLISVGLLKWRKPCGNLGMAKYGEKAPKIVNVKVNPRTIKQPR